MISLGDFGIAKAADSVRTARAEIGTAAYLGDEYGDQPGYAEWGLIQ